MAIQRSSWWIMVLRIGLFFSFGIWILSSCSGEKKPEEGIETDQLVGIDPKALYFDNCASCHGVDGKLGISGASDLSSSKLGVDEIVSILEKGRKNMPAMKEILGGDEAVAKVAEYTLELRK